MKIQKVIHCFIASLFCMRLHYDKRKMLASIVTIRILECSLTPIKFAFDIRTFVYYLQLIFKNSTIIIYT